MNKRAKIIDAFERAFEESNAGRDVIEAVDFARNNCYPVQRFIVRSAVEQAFRALEKQGLIVVVNNNETDKP